LSQEGQLLDKKSLRPVTGKTANWSELAKDCVAFANASGGCLLIGIEDADDLPPPGQRISSDLPEIIRRKLAERTVNVTSVPSIITTPSGDEYINLAIARSVAVVSTLDDSKQIKRAIDGLVVNKEVRHQGDRRWRRYWLVS